MFVNTQLISLGCAAATFQRDPEAIRSALMTLKRRPVFSINGVPYFATCDVAEAVEMDRPGSTQQKET